MLAKVREKKCFHLKRKNTQTVFLMARTPDLLDSLNSKKGTVTSGRESHV